MALSVKDRSRGQQDTRFIGTDAHEFYKFYKRNFREYACYWFNLTDYLDNCRPEEEGSRPVFDASVVFIDWVTDTIRGIKDPEYVEMIPERITELINLRLVHEGAPYTIKNVDVRWSEVHHSMHCWFDLDHSVYCGEDAELADI